MNRAYPTKGPGDLSGLGDPQNEPEDDGELTNAQRLSLLPNVISEVVLDDEIPEAIAEALADGKLAEVGRLFSVARDRYVAELIARKVTEYHGTMDDDEAAERLFQVYS